MLQAPSRNTKREPLAWWHHKKLFGSCHTGVPQAILRGVAQTVCRLLGYMGHWSSSYGSVKTSPVLQQGKQHPGAVPQPWLLSLER